MHSRMVGALIVVALASAACHTIKPVTMGELNAMKPEQAWITESDHSVVLVTGPQVVGDTLVGYVGGQYQEIPQSQFSEVRVQKNATGKTVALVSVIAVGFGGLVYALTGSGSGGKGQTDFCDKHPDDPTCT